LRKNKSSNSEDKMLDKDGKDQVLISANEKLKAIVQTLE
jgi:hypothetical protein